MAMIEQSKHPIALFFDNGDKPREWEIYSGLTHPGDFCIVHDWGTEFTEKDIKGLPVQRILDDMRDARHHDTSMRTLWLRRT